MLRIDKLEASECVQKIVAKILKSKFDFLALSEVLRREYATRVTCDILRQWVHLS